MVAGAAGAILKTQTATAPLSGAVAGELAATFSGLEVDL